MPGGRNRLEIELKITRLNQLLQIEIINVWNVVHTGVLHLHAQL
jgi:hypothetical protein